MSEDEDPKGRIRTAISPAEWAEDQQAAASSKQSSKRPKAAEPEPKAEPEKKAS